jgi:response regulator RpfG family c-di-GMP phosphodiesterase
MQENDQMLDKVDEYNLNEADYLLRECVTAIKGSIDQIYYGLLNYLSEDEQKKFLNYLKTQSDSLRDVLYKSIVQKANQINDLNMKLIKTNKELNLFKKSLEKKVQKSTHKISELQHVTIFALAKLAEKRDQETGDHLSRIRYFAYLIAKDLANRRNFRGYIDKTYIHNIYRSSPLHDIGKVGINDSILLKPGKYTVQEFEIMKNHTIIGGKTLEDAENQLKYRMSKSFLTMGKSIAYCHHERWDGSGYPYGLKGEEIPRSARIVAICDVYDALVSKRVYKDAMSHEIAKEIIIQESGKHFDPRIVESFERLEKKFKERTEKRNGQTDKSELFF